MTTKSYLGQIKRLELQMQNKLSEIGQLRELSRSVSAVVNEERVQTTPNFDKIGTMYCKIEAMEEKLSALIDEYMKQKNEIISQIEGLDDEIYYELLFHRYIERKTFEEIAVDIKYSFRQTLRLHGKALCAFEEKYGHLYL